MFPVTVDFLLVFRRLLINVYATSPKTNVVMTPPAITIPAMAPGAKLEEDVEALDRAEEAGVGKTYWLAFCYQIRA